MKKFILMLVSCCLAFSSMHRVASLKCRTGNQQSDDQFQKIMQICRRRFLGYDRENGRDFNARDTDSQESSDSDSDEDVFDNKFLTSAGNRYGKNSDKMGSGSNSRYDYTGSSTRNNSSRQSSSGRNSGNRYSSGNRSYYDNGYISSSNNRRSMRNGGANSRGGYNGENNYSNSRYNNNNSNNNNNNNMNRNNMNNGNNSGNNNDDGNNEREQACVTQCFFNELNLVDQRGFPERSAVISIMTQNIQDPELRDFVEESVIECYHYLNSNNNGRQEKCQFSQNLLSCLAEKGSERCEDWDDE